MVFVIGFWHIYWAIVITIAVGSIIFLNTVEGLGGLFAVVPFMVSLLMALCGGLAMLFG